MTDVSVFDEIEVLGKFILFQFEELRDANNRNSFHEKRESGIILKSDYDASTKKPRWVKVLAVGPDVCDDIQVGSRVLVQALKWTQVSTYQKAEFARTEEAFILAVDEE